MQIHKIVCVLVIAAFSCVAAWSQGTAQISGIVTDQSGAILPGAEVSATQTETGIVRSTISNETGNYVLPTLAVGPYRLEISLPGFRTFVQTGIVLQVNSNPGINAVLAVGQVSEQIEVQANAALVETRASGVGQVIDNQRILELPLNGRQVTDLIVLAGAAVQTGTASSRAMQGGVGISVAGGLDFGVTYLLDGAMHNSAYDNYNLPFPFPDALQEFKVETNGLGAQIGMHSGGAVNAVTRSGTNEFHGSLFEFVRNDLFNARNYFATKGSTLKRNQFGGTAGGPIKKNKLFFFGGYQGTTLREDPADNLAFIPTTAMMAGDFTTFASPACNGGRQITLRAPFVNNRVDPATFSKAAVKIVGYLPKTEDPCGRIVFGRRTTPNEGQYVGKIDYQLNSSHSVFGRYIANTYKTPPPYALTDNILTSTVGGRDNLGQAFTFGDTYLIGSNIVNAYRLALNRTAIHRTTKDFFSAPDVGINIYSGLPKYTILAVTGGFSIGNGSDSEASFRTTAYQTSDDISLVHGNHQVSAGVSFAHWRLNQYAHLRDVPNFAFDGTATGLGMGDYLTGQLSSLIQATQTRWAIRQWYFGLYGQDTWKVTRKLTLNYGLRWEPYFPQEGRMNTMTTFNLDGFRKGVKSTIYKNAPAGLSYRGDPGFPGWGGAYTRWLDLGPRIGLAWDVNGDGKTSIRAAYGGYYDFVNAQYLGNTLMQPPEGFELRITSPAGGFDDPYRGFPGGQPFPYKFDANSPFLPFGTFLSLQPHMKTTAVQSWNLSVQRQFGQDLMVSASYLGSQTRHLWSVNAANPALFLGLGPCTINGVAYNPCSSTTNRDQRRKLYLENPQEGGAIGFLDVHDDGGTANYNGMLLSVQRRAASGITVGGNYTLSHCIGDGTQGGAIPNVATGPVDPNNRRLDRGNCNSDRRHSFNLTAVAATPNFSNTTLRRVASDWRLSGIYRWSTGSYLTIISGLDRALSGINNQRADQILSSPYGDKSSLTNYFNRAAFAQPAIGTLANLGRNNVMGPPTWQFDAALSRVFHVTERQTVEARFEAYNVTNSLRPGNPDVNFSANTFGRITTALTPRIMQFALKYAF